MTLGFRIGPPGPNVDPAIVAAFAKIPVGNISDSVHRMIAGGAPLRPLGNAKISGPAVAVRTPPGDNLMVHKALDIAAPGSVIVVDSGGDLTNAIIGERMVEVAAHRGLAGFIINGAIRDVDAIHASKFPVFSAGVTHRGPYKNGPGEINFPIAINGMVIESGDIIVADCDGVVCVPHRDAKSVLEAAERKARYEVEVSPLDESREWIDEALEQGGCSIDASYQHLRMNSET